VVSPYTTANQMFRPFFLPGGSVVSELIDIFVLVVSSSNTLREVKNDWQWLNENLLPRLHVLSFSSSDEDVTEFVLCKINSLLATLPTTPEGMPYSYTYTYLGIVQLNQVWERMGLAEGGSCTKI